MSDSPSTLPPPAAATARSLTIGHVGSLFAALSLLAIGALFLLKPG